MKRRFALILVLAMMLSLLACSNNEVESTTPSDPTQATTVLTETPTAPTEKPTEPTQAPTEKTTVAPTQKPTTSQDTSNVTNNSSLEQRVSLAKKCVGRWYLDGYSDVYFDISYEPNSDIQNAYLFIDSNNFAFRGQAYLSDGDIFIEHTVYPSIHLEGIGYTSGKMYILSRWDKELTEDKIKIASDCICIGEYKFVRKQGTKNQHSDFGILEDGEEHDYVSEIIWSTPTTKGYILKTCKVCGCSCEENPPYYGVIDGVVIKIMDTNDAYCVVGITNDASPNITIPDTYLGFPIVSVDRLLLIYGIPEIQAGDPSAIKGITLSSNIKIIEQQAFDCCVNLSTINYLGTIKQWKQITLGEFWNDDSPATKVICTDGVVSLEEAEPPAATQPQATKPPTTEKPTIPPATKPSATEPVSDVLIVRDAQTICNKTINSDVYITSTGVATFKNVTVNGNIYCHGQLKVEEVVAKNVFAYAYGSMFSCAAFDGTHGKISGSLDCDKMTIDDDALDYAFGKWGKTEVSTVTPPETQPTKPTATEKPTAAPTTKPTVPEPANVLIISDTRTISNQTIDTDVYITSTGVATFENVTVNGNVYCYGKLTVSGGSANNLYAYYWDLGGITASCNAWDGSHGLVKGAFRSVGDLVIKDYALDYAFEKWGKK